MDVGTSPVLSYSISSALGCPHLLKEKSSIRDVSMDTIMSTTFRANWHTKTSFYSTVKWNGLDVASDLNCISLKSKHY